MNYTKLIVCLLTISLFTFAAAETNLSSEPNASAVSNSIGILPIEETAPAENTIVIQPIDNTAADAVTGGTAVELNLVYDANGNIVEIGGGLRREYNGLNQLVRIRNISNNNLVQEYVHDPVEERIAVKKSFFTDGTLQETAYYFDKEYVRVVNNTGRYNFGYVYHEGQLVGQELNSVKYYVHADMEGSTSVVTNQSGNVVENKP